jgi:hypothetical protein
MEDLAIKCGILNSSLEYLMSGSINVVVARQLGLPASSIQQFINGERSTALAKNLGITSKTLQDIRMRLDQQGAVGFILGLLIAVNGSYNR